MIYIIDEKTNRQSSYGWNGQKFKKYSDVIKPIHDYFSFGDNDFVNAILSKGNVVLFHESFFNEIGRGKQKMADEFIEKMKSCALDGNIIVAYYGGSKRSRPKDDGQIVYLPVSKLYEHLEIFIKKSLEGQNDINYLLWGNNPEIEKQLIEKIKEANDIVGGYKYTDIQSNTLIIVTAEKQIKLVLPGLQNETKELFPDLTAQDPVSDELLHSNITEWLNEKQYDAILLPLCFGPALSDYNGLRLAMHIRCTVTPNQCIPIYIYSAVDLSYIINNEYFDIIKTIGVNLIDYDDVSIVNVLEQKQPVFSSESLISEMRKIHLNIPKNYIDSHSIANEWAIYRWAKTIGTSDVEINEVVKNVETNLYFKYLNTIYPISSSNQLNKNNLIISTNRKHKPKVLLVDDEAKKGWYNIFCSILKDANGFYFDHLDDEFNEKSSDGIVQIVHDKIVSDDIDIVVLDYRLHRTDFFAERTEDITGYKVLKDIKNKINRGIQVVVLSATNKVWNWESLKEMGADEFIMKDNPESIFEDTSTIKGIGRFVKAVGNCCDRLFLKQFYKDYNLLATNFVPRRSVKSSKPLPKEFVDETIKWYELSCRILSSSVTEYTIASSFLFLFSVLEIITNQIVDVDNPVEYQDPNTGRLIYRYKFRQKDQYLRRFVDETAIKTKRFVEVEDPKVKPNWTQKIYNTLDFISAIDNSVDYRHLVNVRNDFIHANSIDNSIEKKKISICKDDLINLHYIVTLGLNSI